MYEIFENLLKKTGVTSYRVAKDTGITPSTFSDWKSGRSVPKQDKMKTIADYFDVSIDYLLTGEQQKKPTEKSVSLEIKKDDLSNLILQMTTEERRQLLDYAKFLQQKKKED